MVELPVFVLQNEQSESGKNKNAFQKDAYTAYWRPLDVIIRGCLPKPS